MVFLAALIITIPSAAESMDFVKEDIKPVVEFAMDWGMRAAIAVTGTHAFVVVCKRFLD